MSITTKRTPYHESYVCRQPSSTLAEPLTVREAQTALAIGFLTVQGHVSCQPLIEVLNDVGLGLIYDAVLNGSQVTKEDLLYLADCAAD